MKMPSIRQAATWLTLAIVLSVPILAAAASPLLAWRDPVYIAGGFAGIAAMALLLLQPLLAAGDLPGLSGPRGRRVHRRVGGLLAVLVAIHVAGLWVTSPPDMVDALLFRSPTPFSAWGVVAMWALAATALLAALRGRLPLRRRAWRNAHTALAMVIVPGSVVHAVLIDGAMEPVSKTLLCLAVFAATVKAIADPRLRNGAQSAR